MNKPILSIETSSDLCSVALLNEDQTFFSFDIRQKHVHSEKLILMIGSLLKTADVKLEDTAYIAVSMGPGSFTGLRIGLAAVKGLAFGAGIPICPVPTFDAFAYSISRYLPEKQTFVITRIVNRDELFFARFEKRDDSYAVLNELQIIKKDELTGYRKENDLLFGNYPAKQKAVTDTDALSIAKWASVFGERLLTREYDYLEPQYLKNFEGRKQNA